MNAAFNIMNFASVNPYWYPEKASTQSIKIGASQTIAAGTLMGEVTATPGVFIPFLIGAVDGSQVPKCILQYAVTTDAGGLITNWIGPFGVGVPAPLSVPAWMTGFFKTTDLVGVLADAVTAGYLKVVLGNTTTGVVKAL